jgi:hypothetical protein
MVGKFRGATPLTQFLDMKIHISSLLTFQSISALLCLGNFFHLMLCFCVVLEDKNHSIGF